MEHLRFNEPVPRPGDLGGDAVVVMGLSGPTAVDDGLIWQLHVGDQPPQRAGWGTTEAESLVAAARDLALLLPLLGDPGDPGEAPPAPGPVWLTSAELGLELGWPQPGERAAIQWVWVDALGERLWFWGPGPLSALTAAGSWIDRHLRGTADWRGRPGQAPSLRVPR